MSKQLFSVSDALWYIEKFDKQLLEDIDVIDAVELPSDKVHSVSDEKEFADEEKLGFGDSKVVSVSGFVEVLVWTWLIGRPGNIVKGSKAKNGIFRFLRKLWMLLSSMLLIYTT